MTTDIIWQVLQAAGYLLAIAIVVLLWRRALRPSEVRRLWQWLALAWTVNLLGNIAWAVHDIVTGTELDTFSAIDLFYISHYVFVALVLWRYPQSLPRQAGLWIAAVMLVGGVIVWTVYFAPAMEVTGGDWLSFLGLAMYTLMDIGMVTLAWLRVRATQPPDWRRFVLLLALSVTSYAIANLTNLSGYVFSPIAGGVIQNVFWLAADLLVLTLVLRRDPEKGIRKPEKE